MWGCGEWPNPVTGYADSYEQASADIVTLASRLSDRDFILSDHDAVIRIRGAQQNNLRNLDLDLPLGELVVITGVSGSGKSSLAFDTIYAEGQRRYVETFSAYARQFLDRMDKPAVERIDGIPPAIAIDQVNPVRTSRSTVGTMTELNDHLKLLFARAANLYCDGCGEQVRRDTSQSIAQHLLAEYGADGVRIAITFAVKVPDKVSNADMAQLLARQGYTRILAEENGRLEVSQDRFRLDVERQDRLLEAIDGALRAGQGRVAARVLAEDGSHGAAQAFSNRLHCAGCDRDFEDPIASLFSFNSPVGACEACRGFGRTMGIDYDLVIPDGRLSLAQGAVRPWQTPAYAKCQLDLLRHAKRCKVPLDRPWGELSTRWKNWVLDGDGTEEDGKWYGVRRYFAWLETKAYRMHIRVLLSKYRSYEECPSCSGSRLKSHALLWRLGGTSIGINESGSNVPGSAASALPGLNMPELARLPLSHVHEFIAQLKLPPPFDDATQMLLAEIRTRLKYLTEVGLGYLCLDRQSRTLSGGEVQRINLTTALGTSLTNALFVLDEPSIGLHARDMQRIITVLERLRDAGNSLLVVEHDEQLIRAADRVLDMGPGPGENGGEIVAFGTPAQIVRARNSLTGRYLRGVERVSAAERVPRAPRGRGSLKVCGASENNLQHIDVQIPLGRMVCVTGVSGSGKSTLVEDVLHRALLKSLGRPTEAAGAHEQIEGLQHVSDVVLVNQSAIGKSARSNPASYVGAMDTIRKLFAGEPLAQEREYGAGHFSFNSGNGRCASCGGTGFEHVEMQFLSDVYLRCPDCDGARYRSEILDVKLIGADRDAQPLSIADVLALTVTEAQIFFADAPQVLRTLEPLSAVGLGYLHLGQPVPTLSGGEAQRLKLAGRLAKGAGSKSKLKSDPAANESVLFIFDEPTTGLHMADVAVLLRAFDALVDAGHSLLVIEHHLDVIAAADWIIDLGPEGGDAGGQLVDCGTPDTIASNSQGPTGVALAKHAAGNDELRVVPRKRRAKRLRNAPIEIHNAREHNLKNVSVSLPRDRFTVITGVSGSGKSTVAFDILFAEGQRRYLESLNAYARQFVEPASRADVDAVTAIPPTVAIEQRTSRGGRKSTVATMTELHHFLRLLYVKLGTRYCPDCDLAIEPRSGDAIAADLMGRAGSTLELFAPLVIARKGYYTDLAAWAAGKGFSELRVDEKRYPTDAWPRLDRYREHNIDLPVASIVVKADAETELRAALHRALALGKGAVRVREGAHEALHSTVRACPGCARSFEPLDPRLFSYNSRHGWCERCFGTGVELEGFDAEQSGEERGWNDAYEGSERSCRACNGTRLKAEARAVRYREHSIAQLSALSVADARAWFDALARELDGDAVSNETDASKHVREATVARGIFDELRSRLAFLERVGLGYLGLDRSAPTLSGGEAQRLRLAAQLGSNLRGVCYILDEPTIGLHTRDNRMLLDTLKALGKRGNTVVVVEHDEDTIRAAEHLIDLGPGAGTRGGEVVAQGSLQTVLRNRRSLTGRYLAKPLLHPIDDRRIRGKASEHLVVTGASVNNLRLKSLSIPLHRLVCVSGVSGSGKSSLVREVVLKNLQSSLSRSRRDAAVHGCVALAGMAQIQRVLEVDQTPIGKTPRSCPATYIGFFDEIRRLFAQTPEARVRGFTPGRFSFNVAGGRCDACEGQGVRRIEMNFLPDVRVLCDVCSGERYNPQTLGVHYLERNIAQILAMSVDEAIPVFVTHPRIHRALRLLQDVGLGYLTLGQPSPTLSGGEAQRIKLVTELAKVADDPTADPRSVKHTLYLLDEPTIGLHMADVEKLIRVLHRLVDAGNSVIVVEHNLDIVAEADWVIDLGPEGGTGGGQVVAQGPPIRIAGKRVRSHTAQALGEFLQSRRAPSGTPAAGAT
ncbi:MAG: excinuclease ABC subunit A [Gammaproteobacteria bacterium]